MRYRIVILFAEGHVSFRQIIVIVRTHQIVRSRQCSRFVHCFVCQLHIKVTPTLHPCIYNHRNAWVAFHCQCLSPIQFPFRQPPMFTIHIQHGAYHLHLAFRINQCQQLVNIAIRIPKRKYRIAVSLCRHNLIAFHCRIFSVDILQDIRMNQQMIECRIKHSLLRIRSALYSDT